MNPNLHSYRDYLALFENRLAKLEHRDILVFPDRAVGPSAEQALMDLRSNPKTSAHPWPSPGVYTTLRLAKAFAKMVSVEPELSKTKLVERWLTLWPTRPLQTLTKIWDRVDTLLAHSTSSAFWLAVCRDAVEAQDPEITDWFAALTTTLEWCVCCEVENLVGSRWHYLQQVTNKIGNLSRAQLLAVFERSPWLVGDGKIKIHVPLLKAAFPLENEFYGALAANPHLELCHYGESSTENLIPNYEALPRQDKNSRPDIFVVTGATRGLVYTLLESEISKWSLDLPAIPESPLRLDVLREVDHPALQELRATIKTQRPLQSASQTELLAAAEFMGLLSENVASANVHPRWASGGVPCISIDDAWALPRQRLCLVTNPEDFENMWDTLAREQRAKAPLPFGVQHLVGSTGDNETLAAQKYFFERQSDFTKWELTTETTAPSPDVPPQPTLSPEQLVKLEWQSPSGIEELLRCPYKFYDQRILRNEESPELDALSLNALKRGDWLHKALEDFFKNPDFTRDPYERLAQSLAAHVDTYFSKIATPDYLASLRGRIPRFAEDLAAYLRDFEMPLQNLWPQRSHKEESTYFGHIEGIKLRGKVDRIDFLNDKQVLLWDYKSGGNYSLKLNTLLGPTHRKIQWLLYTKIIESSLHVEVVGGGYLQLLKPSYSGIFFFEDRLKPQELHTLKESLPIKDYAVKFVSPKDLELANVELSSALAIAKDAIGGKYFARRPLTENLCQTCSSKVICGRPYFT